ncbi:MAG: CoA ester lyase [Pseudomonadota bacterium]
MQENYRPRRSVLYMPGSNARALEKAQTLAADALILDLEDAVAPAEKTAARDLVAGAVRSGSYGNRELVVRINGLDTQWGEADLEAACAAAPDAILVPKVESAAQVRDIEQRISVHGAPANVAIWAMMETPLGMLNAAEISAASPRLGVLIMGTNDLVKDLHAEHTPDRLPVLTGLGLCTLAARAYGLSIIDGVYNAFKDQVGLRAACLQGKALGMDGKTLIHPAQLAVANEIFAPDPRDVARAHRYVEAFKQAQAEGKGVAVVDGRIVENLHVANAERLIAMSQAIEGRQAAE